MTITAVCRELLACQTSATGSAIAHCSMSRTILFALNDRRGRFIRVTYQDDAVDGKREFDELLSAEGLSAIQEIVDAWQENGFTIDQRGVDDFYELDIADADFVDAVTMNQLLEETENALAEKGFEVT